MKSDAERRAEYDTFKKIDAALRVGDLATLRAAVDAPDSVPNGPMPLAAAKCVSRPERPTLRRSRAWVMNDRMARGEGAGR